MKFEVVNLKTRKSHGEFDSLDEARACVAYDRLTEWEIWKLGTENVCEVVAYRDSGRF